MQKFTCESGDIIFAKHVKKFCIASKVSSVHFLLGFLVDQIVEELNVLYHSSSPHLWQIELVAVYGFFLFLKELPFAELLGV